MAKLYIKASTNENRSGLSVAVQSAIKASGEAYVAKPDSLDALTAKAKADHGGKPEYWSAWFRLYAAQCVKHGPLTDWKQRQLSKSYRSVIDVVRGEHHWRERATRWSDVDEYIACIAQPGNGDRAKVTTTKRRRKATNGTTTKPKADVVVTKANVPVEAREDAVVESLNLLATFMQGMKESMETSNAAMLKELRSMNRKIKA